MDRMGMRVRFKQTNNGKKANCLLLWVYQLQQTSESKPTHTHTNNMFHPNRQPRCTFGMDAAQTLCMEENEVKEKSALILTNNTESRPKHQNKS